MCLFEVGLSFWFFLYILPTYSDGYEQNLTNDISCIYFVFFVFLLRCFCLLVCLFLIQKHVALKSCCVTANKHFSTLNLCHWPCELVNKAWFVQDFSIRKYKKRIKFCKDEDGVIPYLEKKLTISPYNFFSCTSPLKIPGCSSVKRL